MDDSSSILSWDWSEVAWGQHSTSGSLQLERTRLVLISLVVGGRYERVAIGTHGERDGNGRDL